MTCRGPHNNILLLSTHTFHINFNRGLKHPKGVQHKSFFSLELKGLVQKQRKLLLMKIMLNSPKGYEEIMRIT